MAKFAVKLSPEAVRDLGGLEARVAELILSALGVFTDHPFPRGKLIKKIKGKKTTFYRLRVREYRVFYCIQRAEVVVLKIVAKKDAHRFIKNL